MKKFTCIILSVIFITTIISCGSNDGGSSQDKKEFEGKIVYNILLESKTPNISTPELQKLFGNTMTFYIKNGNYKMTYNGTDIKEVYYLSKLNKEYDIRNKIDTLYVTDCSVEKQKLISSEFQPGSEEILNKTCKEIVNEVGESKNHYWFDPDIYLDPVHFKKHKFSYLNLYYEKAQSPCLKYKHEGKYYNLTYTAIALQEKKLNGKLFELPNLPEGKFPE